MHRMWNASSFRSQCLALTSSIAGLQIVGFFIVEERVQAGYGDSGEGWQVNTGWEAAQAALKGRLEAACASYQEHALLRSLKDYALLSCTALGGPSLLAACTVTFAQVMLAPCLYSHPTCLGLLAGPCAAAQSQRLCPA